MAKGAVAKRRKRSKPPASKSQDGVVFKDMAVTLCAPDGGPLRQRIDAHKRDITAAAERGAVGPFEPGEPPTVDKAAEKSEAVFAFADRLCVGSKTFQFHFSQLISEKPSAGFVQAAIDAMEPKDPFEAMLSAQMATIHAAMMEMSGRLGRVEYLPQMREYEGAMNRLARTYTAQMEALRKHRGKGTQTVRHVHVNEGGQAIVADTVNHGGGGGGDH